FRTEGMEFLFGVRSIRREGIRGGRPDGSGGPDPFKRRGFRRSGSVAILRRVLARPRKPLSHLAPSGGLRMVDVSGKPATARKALAAASVVFPGRFLERVLREGVPKGDLFAAARIAGVQAAKRTAELIPLCHPLPLSRVGIAFEVRPPSTVAVLC